MRRKGAHVRHRHTQSELTVSCARQTGLRGNHFVVVALQLLSEGTRSAASLQHSRELPGPFVMSYPVCVSKTLGQRLRQGVGLVLWDHLVLYPRQTRAKDHKKNSWILSLVCFAKFSLFRLNLDKPNTTPAFRSASVEAEDAA